MTDAVKRAMRAFRADTPKDETDAGVMNFVAATENVARDKLVIDISGARLDNYRKNPVVLWGHDYGGFNSPRPPIGKADVDIQDNELRAKITFDLDDPFAADIHRKYDRGFLNAVSIGWDTLKMDRVDNPDVYGRVTEWELLDISGVPVPGDPDALKERQARALNDLGYSLIQEFGDDDDIDSADTVGWRGTAALMARLFTVTTGDDAERRREYNRLARRYRKYGKAEPEFLAINQIAGLGDSELRGLFLEGESDLFPDLFPSVRAGAVLSKRNQSDLEDAISKIQGVIDRASKESADDTERNDTPDYSGILDALNRELAIGAR